MSDFDRGYTRPVAAGPADMAVDAGLRAFMLGVYNKVALGLVLSAALGSAAAWPVVVKLFRIDWSVDWAGILALVAGAALLAGLGGLFAAWRALAQRPAPVLRAE